MINFKEDLDLIFASDVVNELRAALMIFNYAPEGIKRCQESFYKVAKNLGLSTKQGYEFFCKKESEIIEYENAFNKVDKFLASRNDEERKLLNLLQENMTTMQMAQIMQCSERTVYRKTRALAEEFLKINKEGEKLCQEKNQPQM